MIPTVVSEPSVSEAIKNKLPMRFEHTSPVLHHVGLDRWVVANVLVSDNVTSEFELQSCYYIYFRTNILGKNMNPFISPTMC